ncbi:type II secretion system F family protein [Actinoallomurus sp. NPDC052274]|uniref:type II secretion system F family protein n=1 Tax=Actinoallomurus sp. NPDC052274 TaxID=3155420 RepID=UPI003427D8B4
MMGLLAGLAGLCTGSGILLTARGLTGVPPTETAAGRPPARWRELLRSAGDRSRRNRLLAAGGAGLAVLLLVGWPVAAVAVAAGAYVLPRMLSGRPARQRIARLEALEAWARRLAEVMGASRGLEQTLTDSLRVAPAPIREPVGLLAERLNNRAGTEQALRAFAAELADPVGDLIATALILAARRRGPGTRHALTALADAVAQEVRVRREVEAERASLRTTLLVIIISVGTLTALFAASGTLAAPYSTPLGQLVLAAVAALYACGLGWMRRLATITTGTRLIDDDITSDDGSHRHGTGGAP